MIHVCFGLYDKTGRYSKFTGTTICSLFDNTTSEVTVHILHDDTLTQDNREKFLALADRYKQRVNFHNVDELCPRELIFLRDKLADKINSRFSIGAFYRLLAKKILAAQDVHRIIYLDSDIIVNLDIDELWRHDLKNFPLAAVPEDDATSGWMIFDKFLLNSGRVKREDYFCSGVMIINLDALDENFFREGVQFLVDNPECESPDQDILNAFFTENYLKLEQKFDAFANCDNRQRYPVTKKIYHYAGRVIGLNSSNGYVRLWLEYFLKTPWFGVETFGRLNEKFREVRADILNTSTTALMRLSTVMSGKTRAFFVTSADLPSLREKFSIRDDEEIVFADGEKALPNLVVSMSKAQGKKVFFLVVPNFDAVSSLLQQLDFVPEDDFINGEIFLVMEADKEFNSFTFIKAM